MKIKRERGVFSKKIRGRWLLLEKNKEYIRELNEVASYIWGLIKKPVSINQIVTNLCQEYRVGKKKAKQDVEKFIKQYLREGLIKKID